MLSTLEIADHYREVFDYERDLINDSLQQTLGYSFEDGRIKGVNPYNYETSARPSNYIWNKLALICCHHKEYNTELYEVFKAAEDVLKEILESSDLPSVEAPAVPIIGNFYCHEAEENFVHDLNVVRGKFKYIRTDYPLTAYCLEDDLENPILFRKVWGK